MNKSGLLVFLCSWLVCLEGISFASDHTSAQFRSPVDIPIYLAGTFGEIRDGHFHAGIDIKTNGTEGLNVYAVEDGYVSRIKISPFGYGKALYIDHPNGYTTVYGHLQKFAGNIETTIKDIQYRKESFEVDQYFEKNALPVKKGELIAYSGNTGGSAGPHLHYEIRETSTQIPINPIGMGITIKDDLPPVLNDVFIYPMDQKAGETSPVMEKVIKKQNTYSLQYDTVIINSRKIGIGISAFDQMNGSLNKNGIREMKLQVDGETIYQFVMNKISFAETRYVQAHMDYKENELENVTVHRCFQLPGNELSIYDSISNSGFLTLNDDVPHNVVLCIKDFNDNASILNFCIKLDLNSTLVCLPKLDYDTIFDYRTDNIFTGDEVKLFFPKYTFYDSLYFNYEKTEKSPASPILSSIHLIHYDFEPAHRYFSLSIKPKPMPAELKPYAVIVRETRDGKLEAHESRWEGDYITTETRDFGMYYVLPDTTAPTIKPVNVYDNKPLSNQQTIKIKIGDDLSGIQSYRATVDGRWLLMEYDAKNDLLTYFFDDHVKPGEHEFVLLVNDEVRNQSIYKINFRR